MPGKELRINNWNILLNLASEPRRNRRLYFLLFCFLVGLVLLAGALLIFLTIDSLKTCRDLKLSQERLLEKKTGLIEENRWINKELEAYRPLSVLVGEVNSVIEKKAFSWVRFFDRLERCLPPQSYLVSISPSSTSAGREFRVRIAFGRREDLKEMLKNFQAEGFTGVRVLNEILQDGYFQGEIVFTDGQPE